MAFPLGLPDGSTADVTRSWRCSHAFVLCVFQGVGCRQKGCLIAAVVLGCCVGNPESLLSGATPDPSQPARDARDADAVSRLQLTQALQRAKYAIAWERSWPHLARLLPVVGLFLVVSL